MMESIYNCKLKGTFRTKGIKTTNPVAVGDNVRFIILEDSNTGLINEILPRNNYIIRKATKLSKVSHIIAANIDQALLIVTLAQPRTSTGFIDRFLLPPKLITFLPVSFSIRLTCMMIN